jgi:hypothetical protein
MQYAAWGHSFMVRRRGLWRYSSTSCAASSLCGRRTSAAFSHLNSDLDQGVYGKERDVFPSSRNGGGPACGSHPAFHKLNCTQTLRGSVNTSV